MSPVALGYVSVSWPWGATRVMTFADYTLLPTAALLGSYARWATRSEFIRARAEARKAA